MPITINVGLSRKLSRNYQSAGVSLNLTAELDSALLDQPERLQARIADVYVQFEQALDHQVARVGRGEQGGRAWPATPSQHRAIAAICRRLGRDPVEAAREHLGAELNELTVRQASTLIGQLEHEDAEHVAQDNGASH